MPGIILSIDYGKARIGLATSDINQIIAFPLIVVQAGKTHEKSIENILDAIKDKKSQINTVVIGLPLMMNGKEGQMAQEVKEFGKKLEPYFSVDYIDERLSSRGATHFLKDMGLNRKKRSKIIDKTAASLLLQTYLDQKSVVKS